MHVQIITIVSINVRWAGCSPFFGAYQRPNSTLASQAFARQSVRYFALEAIMASLPFLAIVDCLVLTAIAVEQTASSI